MIKQTITLEFHEFKSIDDIAVEVPMLVITGSYKKGPKYRMVTKKRNGKLYSGNRLFKYPIYKYAYLGDLLVCDGDQYRLSELVRNVYDQPIDVHRVQKELSKRQLQDLIIKPGDKPREDYTPKFHGGFQQPLFVDVTDIDESSPIPSPMIKVDLIPNTMVEKRLKEGRKPL